MLETRTTLGLHADEIWLGANLIARAQADPTFDAVSLIGTDCFELGLTCDLRTDDVARMVAGTAALILATRTFPHPSTRETELADLGCVLAEVYIGGSETLRHAMRLATRVIRPAEINLVLALELVEVETMSVWNEIE